VRIPIRRHLIKTVLADPPWKRETGGGKIRRGADKHYPLMSNSEILSTMTGAPIWQDVGDDAHLYLWVTNNALTDGLWLTKELGFRYITMITWAKMKSNQDHSPADIERWSLQRQGLGRYFCGQTEQLLFATRGKAMVPEPINRGRTIILAPKREHSRKPKEQYELIEKVSPGRYLEMFQRGASSNGWLGWGNEYEDPSLELG